MISFNRRFSPALTRAAEWVRAQGPLESVEARMLRHNRREPGFMTDTGIHLVDATASLLENPRIDAVRHAPGASGVQALMSDAAGRTASVTILPVCGCVAEEYSICGEAFRAEVDVGACTFRGWRAGELAAEWRAPDEWPKWMLAGAYAETEAFLQMAEGVGPCQPDLHAGLASMQLVERLAQ
jgi:predicted dehydrogenase